MKRLTLTAFALLASAALAAAPARAQQTSDADAVRAAIDGMFDGMRAGDSTMVRAAFHPTMRLQSVGRREGAVVLREDSADAFVRAVGTPHVEVWDERLGDVEVRVDGDLAQAWMPYTFYRGETLSHCGVNAMHLVRTPQGWKITQITDTRRREGCTPRAAATKGRN
jgi:opacity protein-like surface antigen